MKKLFLLLALPFVLMACDDKNDLPQPVPQADITVIAYMVAENNLDYALKENIRTMFMGLATSNMSSTLLIYWDGNSAIGNYDNPVILRYNADGRGKINGTSAKDKEWELADVLDLAEIVKEYPEQLSTDKTVMARVLSDLTNLSTTSRVGMIAGAHATSWIKSSSDTRAFGEENGNWINIADMADAMKSTNRIFDFLLFDACLMGSAEVCYDFKDVVNYQIVSTLEIPVDGFPYNLMINYLFEGTKEGYQSACKTYIEYYGLRAEKNIVNSWGTISLIDSHKIEPFSEQFKNQIITNKDLLRDFDVTQIQEYGRQSSFKYVSIDSRHFIKVLNGGIVPSEFDKALNEVVIYTDCLDKTSYNASDRAVDKENYCGLGVYVPIKGKYDWNIFFKTIGWYTVAGWGSVSFDWDF